MLTCPTCGVARSYVGVMFPARLLCGCEKHSCAKCDATAVGVEFQRPVRDQEPSDCVHWCKAHKPDDFPADSIVAAPAPTRAGRRKKETGRPHIDPAWSFATPPPGAEDRQKVKCAVCHDTHSMRDRCLWNGTESQCPKCGETVTVFADEEVRP